jgi:microtubule-associated protein-like 1/2
MDGSIYSDELMSSSEGDRDRLDELEKRVNMQADEIVLLKSLIADLVRRLNELESASARNRSHTVNGSTLTLPTKSSAGRSLQPTRNTGTTQNPPASARPSHHLSTESLQSSSSTLQRPSSGYGLSGMRTSPSMDRLGLSSARSPSFQNKSTFSVTQPASARSNTIRKWTSNSDFQNGTSASSPSHHHTPTSSHSGLVHSNTNHVTHSPVVDAPSPGQRRYSSQSQLSELSSSPLAPPPGSHRSTVKDPVFNPDDGYLHVSIRGKGMNFYVPSEECLTQSLTKPNPPPTQRLKLQWVYGYRGRDCRSNLHCIATGECVYFIASVVVLVNFQEDKQRHYLGHTDDIRWYAKLCPNHLFSVLV